MTRKAFTLIELLVVIAIIAILAAILFPVFAQAKAAAKQSGSLAEVKQIGTANAIYLSDADDQTVPYLWYQRADGVWLSWMEMLNPYAKSTAIYVHSAQSTDQSVFGSPCATTASPVVVSHYAYPMWVRYSYYQWNSTTVMSAGFPIASNAITSAAGNPCDPAALAANPFRACIAPANAENPSATAMFVPGYFIAYKRPAPAPESDTKFGSSCTTGYAPEPADATGTNRVHVFHGGGNYGMVDTSAKYYATTKMNRDNSRTVTVAGSTIPASPYMWAR